MKRTWKKRLLSLACAGVMLVSALGHSQMAEAASNTPQEMYKWTRIDDIDQLRKMVKEGGEYRLLILQGSMNDYINQASKNASEKSYSTDQYVYNCQQEDQRMMNDDGKSMPRLTHYLRLLKGGSGGDPEDEGYGFTVTPVGSELGVNVFNTSTYGALQDTFYTLDGLQTPYIKVTDKNRPIEGYKKKTKEGDTSPLAIGENGKTGVAVRMYLTSESDTKPYGNPYLIAVAGKSTWFQMKKGWIEYGEDYYDDHSTWYRDVLDSMLVDDYNDEDNKDNWKYNTDEWVLYSPTKTWPNIYNTKRFNSSAYSQIKGYLMIGASGMHWTDYPVTLSYERVPGNVSNTDPNKYLAELDAYQTIWEKAEDARRIFKCYLGEKLKDKVAYREITTGNGVTVAANQTQYLNGYTHIKEGAKVTVKKGGTLFITGTTFLDGMIVNDGGKVVVQSGALIRNGPAAPVITGRIDCKNGGEIIVRRGARICLNHCFTAIELSDKSQLINKGLISFYGNIHVYSGSVLRNDKGAYLMQGYVLLNGYRIGTKADSKIIDDGYLKQSVTTTRVSISGMMDDLTKDCADKLFDSQKRMETGQIYKCREGETEQGVIINNGTMK